MNKEHQRIAIAEACGSNSIREQDYDHGYSGDDVRQMWVGLNPDSNEFEQIPDYLNDLNAIHEAEKELTEEQRGEFSAHLVRLTKWNRAQDHTFAIAHATASQRAEAFLRTLNLWKE